MAAEYSASEDALFARADRAIAAAVAMRGEIRAELAAAKQRPIRRPDIDRRPALPAALEPPPIEFLEPWWSIARSMNAARDIMREADYELDRALNRILPTIETPLDLIRG